MSDLQKLSLATFDGRDPLLLTPMTHFSFFTGHPTPPPSLTHGRFPPGNSLRIGLRLTAACTPLGNLAPRRAGGTQGPAPRT